MAEDRLTALLHQLEEDNHSVRGQAGTPIVVKGGQLSLAAGAHRLRPQMKS